MTRKKSRIVYSLFLILLLVGTVPLVAVGWVLLNEASGTLRQNQRIMQLQIGKLVSNDINSYMDRSIRRLNDIENALQLGEGPLLARLQQPRSVQTLQQIVEGGSKEGLLLAAVYGQNELGRGIQAGYSFSDAGLKRLMQDAYLETLQSRRVLTSAPYNLPSQNRAVVVAAKPIGSSGDNLGVILEVVDLDPVRRIVDQNTESKNRILLLDSRHWLFMQSQAGARPISPEAFQRQPIVRELEKQTKPAPINQFYFDPERSTTLVMTAFPVPNLGWHVIVQADEQDIFSPVRDVLQKTIALIFLFVCLAAALSLIFARRISQPINQLAATTRSISQGNFSERVNISANNEIGEFGENFNLMAERIEDYVNKLQDAVQQNKQLFLESIQTLAAAIDEKDPYTKGHSERVTHYSMILGRIMGLKEEALEKLRIAGLLHDIGKIGIDDRILKKPDVLTPEEFAVMKQHTEKGANIVGRIAQLRDVVPGIRHHHEQLDGNGYPHRLSGEQIPLMARIIGVADTFDAMTTLRPYQRPMSTDFVLNHIRSQIGIKYDGTVVAALEQAVAEGKIKSFKGQVAKNAVGG